MGKKVVLLFVFVFLISFISASSFGYNYLKAGERVVEGENYTINVNNSDYFQGYTPTTLGNWLETTFGWITNAVNDLVNYYTKTEINNSFVPYTGATSNVDLGSYNLTASNFFGTFSGNSSIWSRAGTNTFLTNVGDDVDLTGNLTIEDTLKITNTTTTWNMYVDVNGTLVWEQE